ncbi:hypothetical protein X474_09490 [Dethiosulfatarculus sandiegensis]|uniref:Uncharacterized protein n=1 Tax=Dethiosulfatarculus sandiegensis TaxID=1429043 RepID=A0A0D2JFA9_9BACT|nr:hypothetical protein X474_09490 [Dethiosulfatarculus sandiegensis]
MDIYVSLSPPTGELLPKKLELIKLLKYFFPERGFKKRYS